MITVWLSTTYYLDPRIINLSEGAECLFLRSMAYCGAAETRGFVPELALKTLGVRALNRKKSELLCAGLWTEVEGGYRLSSWAKWQKNGDDLLKRKEADRNRKAKEREVSRDSHVTVQAQRRGEEKREGKTQVGRASLPTVETSLEERPGPEVGIDGWKLVRDLIPDEHPQAVRSGLAIESTTLLKSGSSESDVREALTLWLSKPNLGPRVLPSLVSEAIRKRAGPKPGTRRSTTDDRMAAIQALKHPTHLEIA
jgi:hypothetical protein